MSTGRWLASWRWPCGAIESTWRGMGSGRRRCSWSSNGSLFAQRVQDGARAVDVNELRIRLTQLDQEEQLVRVGRAAAVIADVAEDLRDVAVAVVEAVEAELPGGTAYASRPGADRVSDVAVVLRRLVESLERCEADSTVAAALTFVAR